MKTFAKLAPLAALLVTLFAAPASFADTAKDVTLKFHYDHSATAETTYADLQRQAMKACARTTGHTLVSRADRACARDLVNQVVDKIGDVRLAALSGRAPRLASLD